MFLRQIGVIARKPPARVHPEEESEPKSLIKTAEATSEAPSNGTTVESVPTPEYIETLRFENSATAMNVTVNN